MKASYEGICVELKRKNNTTLVLLLSNNFDYSFFFMIDPLNIILTVSVYDNQAIGSSAVVNIFYMGIIS